MNTINYYCRKIGNLNLTNLHNGCCSKSNFKEELKFIPTYFFSAQSLVQSLYIRYKDIYCFDILRAFNSLLNEGVSYNFKVIIDMEDSTDEETLTSIITKIGSYFYSVTDHFKYGKIIFFIINFNGKINDLDNYEIFQMQNLVNDSRLTTGYLTAEIQFAKKS